MAPELDRISILIVAETLPESEQIEEDLADGGRDWFTLTRLHHLGQAAAFAADMPPDLVLLDWHCRGMGPNAIAELRKASPGTAIVVFTRPDDTNVGLLAVTAGAEECICPAAIAPKALRNLLVTTVRRTKLRVESETEARERRQRLERMLHVDEETGLHNAAYLCDRLEREITRSARYGNKLAVAVIDLLDHREIEAAHGPDALREALRAVGAALKRGFRRIDEVGSLGAPRFAVICVESTTAQALVPIERIMGEIESKELDLPAGGKFGVSLACGIAEWRPGMADVDVFLFSAIRALNESLAEPPGKRIRIAESEGGGD